MADDGWGGQVASGKVAAYGWGRSAEPQTIPLTDDEVLTVLGRLCDDAVTASRRRHFVDDETAAVEYRRYLLARAVADLRPKPLPISMWTYCVDVECLRAHAVDPDGARRHELDPDHPLVQAAALEGRPES